MTGAIQWLNGNRMRSYPMRRDPWRRLAPAGSPGLDCVLLDALVFDADAPADSPPELTVESVRVDADSATVSFSYAGRPFGVELRGGDAGGEGSYVRMRGTVPGAGRVPASVSLAFSSHAYILSELGAGVWTLGCPVLKSRVVCPSDAMGVEGISTNGSDGVEGRSAATATGEVVLEDGYRTSPVIFDGRVLVRVGTRYGLDPCRHDFGDAGSRDCRRPLFFLCGQNAINGGNVILRGGRGISVRQGGTYRVDDPRSKCNGRAVPCIEIVAGRELLDLYAPEGGKGA